MIQRLSGTVIAKDLTYAVIDVGGVGFKVFMTQSLLAGLELGETAGVSTYLAVRENALDLYGFKDVEELRFFELLISISGIGPKSALSILNVTTIETLKQAVYSEDTSHLTRVSGIGRKNAEKIIIELRGKIDGIGAEGGRLKEEVDVLEALRSLGYSAKESQDALKKIPKEVVGAGEKVKHALKHLSQ